MNSIASINNQESDHAEAIAQDVQEIRVEKISTIRRQLGEGRYFVADKLNVVVDRMLEELLEGN